VQDCHGGIVSSSHRSRWASVGLLALIGLSTATIVLTPAAAHAQDELTRKVKNKVTPAYPEIARRMRIAGTVKVEVVVAPNGSVKDTKVVGGHPILVNAAMDAIKKWRFEPGPEETTGTVEFKFQPQNQN
jgi:TonB family protein